MYGHNDIAVFCFNSELNEDFITRVDVWDCLRHATVCRTQIEVKSLVVAINSLKQSPLGNNHLI